MEYLIPILTALGGLGIGGIFTWYFGGRQSNKLKVDNDSHQREKDFFELVDSRSEKVLQSNLKRIIRCAEKCPHSANCPVIDFWKED